MKHHKDQAQYAKSMALIKEAKKHDGKILEAGLNLERALDLKIEALNDQRYEEAARHREKEKAFALQLKRLLEAKKDENT